MPKFNFLPVDFISAAFFALNIAAILLSAESINDLWSLLLPSLAFLAAIPVFARGDAYFPKSEKLTGPACIARSVFDVFRLGYPLMTMLFFYVVIYRYDNLFFPELLDPAFAAADQFLFGYQPARVWMERYDSFWISEILHAAYFLYYFALGLVPFYLFFAKREKLNESIFAMVTVFYASAVTYLVLPVAGGRFDPEIMAITETFRHGSFTRLMAELYRRTPHFGAAFPSTHAALSMALIITALRCKIPLRSLVVVNGLLVFVAAVYCGYHYFVDIPAGILYAGIFYPAGIFLHRKLAARRSPVSALSQSALVSAGD